MRAVITETLGPPEAHHLTDIALPEPGPAQVRIRVSHASLGYADALVALGGYQVVPPLPYTPGTEGAGTIDAVGAEVSRFRIGDVVTASAFGGALADAMIADELAVQPIPPGMDMAKAACFRSNFQTSLHALVDRGRLVKGETLLVLGAAGGVGSAAVQLGKAIGARVIAGASSEEKRQFALLNGADEVLDYSREGWREPLKAMTTGRGPDVIFDPVGGDLLETAFRSIAWNGRYLVVGFAGGPIPKLPVNLPLLKGASLIGVDIRQFSIKQPSDAEANNRRLSELIEQRKVDPPIGPIFHLKDFREALRAAAGGKVAGKVVVAVNS